MNSKPIVLVSLFGTRMDQGRGPRRWEKWRPTLSVFQRDDLSVARLELLVPSRAAADAALLLADVGALSPETAARAWPFDPADPWDFEEVYEALLTWASAYPWAPDDEEVWVHLTTGTHVAQICLFLLTEARFIPGRLLQTAPPRGAEQGGRTELIDLDLARYDRIARRFDALASAGADFLKAGIQTRNVAFNALIDRIERVAGASVEPILLLGPTGAGKSALARRITELKRARRLLSGPLVEVNCATLRGDEARSALFGHKKGSFTGASGDRPGLLKRAHGGLLFLDEVGELGADEQAMLLRALEEKRFLPVGADQEVHSDFQLIAGTNRPLDEAARQGRFRRDLLARLDLWTFHLPALAERREDIEPNLDFELEALSRRLGRRVSMNREARAEFLRFALSSEATWEANFRDLNAAVSRMATLASGARIGAAEVRDEVQRLRSRWRRAEQGGGRVLAALGPVDLDRFDRAQLEDVLEVCARSSSLSEAGRALFAVSRAQKASSNDADRLRKYLARFGLSFEALAGQGSPTPRP